MSFLPVGASDPTKSWLSRTTRLVFPKGTKMPYLCLTHVHSKCVAATEAGFSSSAGKERMAAVEAQ